MSLIVQKICDDLKRKRSDHTRISIWAFESATREPPKMGNIKIRNCWCIWSRVNCNIVLWQKTIIFHWLEWIARHVYSCTIVNWGLFGWEFSKSRFISSHVWRRFWSILKLVVYANVFRPRKAFALQRDLRMNRSFDHFFRSFPVLYCMTRVNTNLLLLAMELWIIFTESLDVSEESEYDLWSDRFGSWIGRSSKSRSPDSLKHLRYDRKSSSGYFLLLFCFVQFSCTQLTLIMFDCYTNHSFFFFCCCCLLCTLRWSLISVARFFRSDRKAIEFR